MFSSEEKAATKYLWAVAVILFLAFGTMIFLSWVVDPLGVLREKRAFPKLCADGIKTISDRSSIPLLPLKTDFSQAIIGTSRIKRGFTLEAFEKSTLKKTVNLGINGLTMKELYQLSEPLIQSNQLDTLWIGLDFGMFGKKTSTKMKVFEKSQTSYDQLLIFFAGTLSFRAWSEAIFVLRHFNSCTTVVRNYRGFITSSEYWNKKNSAWNQKTTFSGSVKLVEGRLLNSFSKTDAEQPERYQNDLVLLKQLITTAAARSVQLHLFINPSPPKYFDILAQADKLDDYQQWKYDIETLIQDSHPKVGQPKFLDFSGWYAKEDVMPPECHDSFSPPCPFYDFTHFRPHVGWQVVEAFQAQP